MRIGMIAPLDMRVPPLAYGGTEAVVGLLAEGLARSVARTLRPPRDLAPLRPGRCRRALRLHLLAGRSAVRAVLSRQRSAACRRIHNFWL